MIKIGNEEVEGRYITDSNGVPHEVVAAYVGNNLVYNAKIDEANAEFYYRKTGGTQSVGSGIAAIKEVRGKSIVWNQLIKNGDFVSSSNWTIPSSLLSTISINNGCIFSNVRENAGYLRVSQPISFVSGHKYYVKAYGNITSGSAEIITIYSSGYTYTYVIKPNKSDAKGIFTATNEIGIGIMPSIGSTTNGSVSTVILFDLTLMFGAGNEPTTVEEFDKMFPLDYYDYNAGEVIPFAGQNLVTTGFNQWDEEYLYGYYSSQGTYISDPNQLCSKTRINVFPETEYYFKNVFAIKEFDANGVFVATKTVPSKNGKLVTESNTAYIHIGLGESYGGVYQNDVCINISNPDRNGTYRPYEKHTLPLDTSQWRDKQGNLVFPYGGMHGVGTAYDYAKVDADGYIRKAVRCFGQVDLGSLNYTMTQPSSERFANCFSATLPIKAKAVGRGNLWIGFILPNGYIPEYGFGPDYVKNKSLNTYNGNGITLQIGDNSYFDAATFKSAMNGVLLIYELAKPVEVELATPIYAKYLVDKDGTEEITPANDTTPYTTMANLHLVYHKK